MAEQEQKEREAFEQQVRGWPESIQFNMLRKRVDGEYEFDKTRYAWEGYKMAARATQAQPDKAEVVDVDGICLRHVNAARAQHEVGALASVMKASSTELLWACRRLARENAALLQRDNHKLTEELVEALKIVAAFNWRNNRTYLLEIVNATLAKAAQAKAGA